MSGLITNQYVLPVLMGLGMVGLSYLDAMAFNEKRSNATYIKLFLGTGLLTWLTFYLLVGKSTMSSSLGGSSHSMSVSQGGSHSTSHSSGYRSVDPRVPRF